MVWGLLDVETQFTGTGRLLQHGDAANNTRVSVTEYLLGTCTVTSNRRVGWGASQHVKDPCPVQECRIVLRLLQPFNYTLTASLVLHYDLNGVDCCFTLVCRFDLDLHRHYAPTTHRCTLISSMRVHKLATEGLAMAEGT